MCMRSEATGLSRPCDDKDVIDELTGTYLQRVGAALSPRDSWPRITAHQYCRIGELSSASNGKGYNLINTARPHRQHNETIHS